MLSLETLAEYRAMTNQQRLTLTVQMIEENTPYLLRGPQDVVARRFELIRRESDQWSLDLVRQPGRLDLVKTRGKSTS